MRFLSLLLLLANLFALGWYLLLKPQEVELSPLPAGVKRLMLVSERPPEMLLPKLEVVAHGASSGDDQAESDQAAEDEEPLESAASAESESASAVNPSLDAVSPQESGAPTLAGHSLCFTLGPFSTVDSAGGVREKIMALGLTTKLREISEPYPSTYQVYLPALPSLAEAKRTVERLAGKGIKDYYLMLKAGKMRYAISLGLFKEQRHALRRVAYLERRGFSAEILSRTRLRTLFWLDYADNRQQVSDEMLAEFSAEHLQRLQHPCK